MLSFEHGINLDENELDFRFVRSRGPGGQHVNKASTAVQLRLDVANSASLPDRVKRRLRRLAGSAISRDGVLLIHADEYRSQLRNKQAAMARLTELIVEAARPVRKRVATRPTRDGKEKRLERKRQRGNLKKDRGWRPGNGG